MTVPRRTGSSIRRHTVGKRSVRENKNRYQICRENEGLTRDQAAEKMAFVSADRIEKIESERSPAHPEEVMAMASCYHAPRLKNLYCVHECPLGAATMQEIPEKDLTRIALELLNELNGLEKERERLIEITSDGVVSKDELPDFNRIKDRLSRISLLSSSLQLWLETEKGVETSL